MRSCGRSGDAVVADNVWYARQGAAWNFSRYRPRAFKAIGLLVVAGPRGMGDPRADPRFSRMCGDLDEVAKTITFDITTREMRQPGGRMPTWQELG